MTAEQLEALIQLMETLTRQANHELESIKDEREALRRVYAAFNVTPPPFRGL